MSGADSGAKMRFYNSPFKARLIVATALWLPLALKTKHDPARHSTPA
jgi:hypothetical protein